MTRASSVFACVLSLAATLVSGPPASAQGTPPERSEDVSLETAAEPASPAPPEATLEPDPVEAKLAAIREDLVQLRLEEALAALEGLLADPSLGDNARADAWILRSQIHVAYGDLDAAEADYRQILQWRPSYRPDRTLTPSKAMARWQAARDDLIGAVELNLQPWDSRVFVDGREAFPDARRRVELVAGEHELRIAKDGFDDERRTVTIEAGTLLPLEFRLLPNARDVVFRTRREGVEIRIDGVVAGRTAAVEGSDGAVAELRVASVPLGEHTYAFSKECFRTETFDDVLDIDLMDLQPKYFRPLELTPARGTLVVEREEGGELLLDGVVADPPRGPWSFCPGPVLVEWRLDERTVWRERVEIVDGEQVTRRLAPRPTVAVFSLDEWPRDLDGWADAYSLVRRNRALPELPERPESWADAALDAGIDLAIGRRRGAGDRFEWILYQPSLDRVDVLPDLPPPNARPRWTEPDVGAVWARIPGTGDRWIVLSIVAGGPAATAGLAVGNRLIGVSADSPVRELNDGTWRLTVDVPGAVPTVLDVPPRPGPRWTAGASGDLPPGLWAAWASVDARRSGAAGLAAQLNLAAAWLQAGRPEDAVALLRRVDRTFAGVGPGAAAYVLGRALRAAGDDEGAVEAFRRAAASDDRLGAGGVPVAPAARDRLADLGVRAGG